MAIIHCIGDSNTSLFSGVDSPDYVNKVYPKLMKQILPDFRVYQFFDLAFNMDRNILSITEIFNKFIVAGDSVLFSYGKRDCRSEVKRQSEIQGKSIDEIIKEIVDTYFKTLLSIKETSFKEKSLNKFMVYNAVAQGPTINKTKKLFYGTQEERISYTMKFNEYLKKLCEENDMIFIHTFPLMVNENNMPLPGIFTKDQNHLNQILLVDTVKEIYSKINS